jgi:hypothetical protein
MVAAIEAVAYRVACPQSIPDDVQVLCQDFECLGTLLRCGFDFLTWAKG